jgi:hypothetical protein
MRRNVMLAALIAVICGVFVWLLRDSNDGTSVAATVRGANKAAAIEPAPQEIAGDVAREDQALERSAVAAADGAIAREVETREIASPPVEGPLLEVRVVDRATQKPVAGARVVLVDNPERSPSFDMARVVRRGDLDARLSGVENVQIADASGIVHFPRAHESAVVAARFEHTFGIANVQGDMPKPIVVELIADGDLAVRVVDVPGKPSPAISVALRRRQAGILNDYSIAETDGEGRAALHHALALVGARPKPINAWHVALRGVFYPPIDVEVDPTLLAGGTAQLVVPAHGECEVVVLDEHGAPCTESLSIGLRVERDESGGMMRTNAQYVGDGGLRYEDVATGRQLFALVQLGCPLEAFVTRTGSEVLHRASGNAIAAAGQRTKITVKLAETACVLAGRVLDQDGRPLGAATARARMQRADSRGGVDYSDAPLALDAQARFRFDIDVSRGSAPNAFVVYTCDAERHEQLSAARDLPAPLDVGLHDLGDLTLEASPRVAAGVVLDHRGQPVAGATIHIGTEDREETNPSWMPLDLPETRSDAQGRFDVRARMALPQIEVLAERDGSSSNTVAAQPGADDLVLLLPESGNVAGRVLLDDTLGKPGALIEMVYSAPSAGENSPPSKRTMLDKKGEFEIRGLRAGTYEVRVSSPNNWIPLARVAEVAIEADRTTRDPRLDPLDLRGQLLSFTLRVVDAHDAPVPQSWLVVHRGDLGDETFDDSNALGNTIKHGVVCSLAGVDVRAGAPGMRDVELRGVKTNTTIVLAPGPRLRLTLQSPPRIGAPLELGVMLIAESQTRTIGPLYGTPPRFDADGVALCPSPVVGRARVQFVVVRVRPNSAAWAEVATSSPQFIDIRDEPGEQSFDLTFDPVDLDAAQRQLTGG